MSTRWTFLALPGHRFELVLVEDNWNINFKHVLWSSGYISSNLGDILKAEWYLNYNRCYGLDDRQIQILDRFKSVPQKF